MKPTELRIGNYVMDLVSGEWMIVTKLDGNIGAAILNRDKFPLADGWQMGGIPLTADLLLRCGFVRIWEPDFRGGEYYYKNGVTVKIHWNKSLHWLQNYYYFNYNGTELEVKQ